MRRIGLCVVLLALVPAMSVAKTIYVKPSGSGNGTSWTNAYGDLQDALDGAAAGDAIWVAAGTYTPSMLVDGTRDQFKTFQMKNGVAIYGGFAGTESVLSQRDIYNNETIISGDLNGDDGPNFTFIADNSYHVFYHPTEVNLDASAVLDGFTITGGYAHLSGEYTLGAGMCNVGNSPTVRNCTFTGNLAHSGAGMCNDSSNPTVVNCTFTGNWSYSNGGGMLNTDLSNPTVTNCIFSGNTAQSGYGAGMFNYAYSNPSLLNCTFSGNTAGYYGGGMANLSESVPTVTNCILYGNSAAFAGDEIYNSSSTPLFVNSNIAGCLSGNSWDTSLGIDGGGNMDENPNFDSFLQLQSGSPCIDAADGDAAASTDLLGNARYDDPDMSNIGTGFPDYVDMGAYESLNVANAIVGDIDADGDVDLVDFAILSAAWMSDDTPSANWNQDCDLDSSGVIDTGDLLIFMNDWLVGK